MPVESGVGHSAVTPGKEQDLAKLLRWHIAIVKSVWQKYDGIERVYYYADANAGPGYYEVEVCPGSPVVFLEVAKQMMLPYKAAFIEMNPVIAETLRERIGESKHVSLYIEDNSPALTRIISQMPRNRYGLIYFDPNGPPNFGLLSRISRMPECRKIDFLVRYSGTAVKRVRQYTGYGLLDALHTIGKSVWLGKELDDGDPHQWTFLFGTNYEDQREWRNAGFIRLDSPRGMILLERLHYTNAQLETQRQPTLFQV